MARAHWVTVRPLSVVVLPVCMPQVCATVLALHRGKSTRLRGSGRVGSGDRSKVVGCYDVCVSLPYTSSSSLIYAYCSLPTE